MFYKKRRGNNPDDEVRERVKPNKDKGFRDFTTTKIVDLLKICKNLARGMSMSRDRVGGADIRAAPTSHTTVRTVRYTAVSKFTP